ncbi:MAG TPA: hypothetical protein VEW95_01095 [Candidatus Limnocylindrales bacterium]|nr:hypothetical protein [Candidatus Limnocylindrales bacterium]
MPHHRIIWVLTALALVAVGLYAATRVSEHAAQPVRTPEAVGGAVIATPDSVALPPVTPEPSPTPTAAATSTPEAAPTATAAPTAVASVVPTPPPVVAEQTPTSSPPPTTTIIAGDPAEAVLAFYQAAAGDDYDAAYALWNERMRAVYPREPNLDLRFDETVDVTFSQLSVAEVSGDAATVQANFTETYESGASRQFIGYWRLVLVDGRWLLDEPHY